ncbi:putative laccase-5 [Vitis vinifera]|uniref:Putative laccase-5 n=1 Tax=Vitis vinifera TaxID=29760 RepID=A0A438ECI7_VITVI|nr:putative laccase-5 [Vitis vinifera]
MINAALHEPFFFSIAKHKITVVGTDGSYTKPLTTRLYHNISWPNLDVLLEANQRPDHYYMAAIAFPLPRQSRNIYDNTTTTAIVQYRGYYTPSSPPFLPHLPAYNDTNASFSGVYEDNFPSVPPVVFDFTADYLPLLYQLPSTGTKGQSTPCHLHGHSFYVVGWGFGNFDENRDPMRYNLVDPPHQNTISVPKNGWVAIRFEASNLECGSCTAI